MPSDPTILAFDTSAAHCAAALLKGGRIIASRYEEMKRGQAERLMPLLQSMLKDQGMAWEEFSAFGVGVGPGNFTGIRIAVSAARGLALATGIPAIGSSSFEVAFDPEKHGAPTGTTLNQQTAPPPARSVLLSAPRAAFYAQAFHNGQPFGPATAEEPNPEADTPQLDDVNWQKDGIERLAQITAEKLILGQPLPRPTPLYVRAADAAPPKNPAPIILP